MARMFFTLAAATVLAATSGCAVCQSPFDFCYPAYGGRWPEESTGPSRAGSAFGGVVYSGETVVVDESGAPRQGEPTPAAEPPREMEVEMEMDDPAPTFVPRQPSFDLPSQPSVDAPPRVMTPLEDDLNP